MDHCEQCGFVYDSVPAAAVPEQLRSQPSRYAAVLRAAQHESLARARPGPQTWSALEYACHVRDVLRVQRERLQLALEQERPVFTPMRRDERAVEDRYNEQAVDVVLDELAEAAERIAAALDGLNDVQWQRTGVYNWPQHAERSMAWVARHTVHEGVHHLEDITTGLDILRRARDSGE
ncbi:MAG: DinB family protein [Egibacteraceae bacterium]